MFDRRSSSSPLPHRTGSRVAEGARRPMMGGAMVERSGEGLQDGAAPLRILAQGDTIASIPAVLPQQPTVAGADCSAVVPAPPNGYRTKLRQESRVVTPPALEAALYTERGGYREDFLGDGARLRVALPTSPKVTGCSATPTSRSFSVWSTGSPGWPQSTSTVRAGSVSSDEDRTPGHTIPGLTSLRRSAGTFMTASAMTMVISSAGRTRAGAATRRWRSRAPSI